MGPTIARVAWGPCRRRRASLRARGTCASRRTTGRRASWWCWLRAWGSLPGLAGLGAGSAGRAGGVGVLHEFGEAVEAVPFLVGVAPHPGLELAQGLGAEG